MKSAPTPARRCRFHSSTVAAFGLGGGHAHRDAAHLLDVLDFDVAVAEAQEFGRPANSELAIRRSIRIFLEKLL